MNRRQRDFAAIDMEGASRRLEPPVAGLMVTEVAPGTRKDPGSWLPKSATSTQDHSREKG